MTGTSVSYKVGPCPNCGAEVWQRFSLAVLRIEGVRLEYYCGACDHVWRPTPQERLALEQYLEREQHERDLD